MDRYAAQARPPTRRKPLGDATFRANSATSPPQRLKKRQLHSSPPARLPHNESFVGNGKLTVRNGLDSPEHPRISAIANDERVDSKRLSAISTTSTNASNAGPRRKSHIGPWQLGRTIGKGGCSRVRAVRHAYTNQLGAAKIISKSVAEKARAISLANLIASAEHDPSLLASGRVIPFGLEREIVIMKLLNHRNIVRLYDVWENRNELYLIMEFVKGGELFHYVEESGGLDESQVVYLFRQIIAALLYCHRIHIHHRDLKPENILLDRHNWEIKLVDFGMAALQPQGKYLSTPCGSPHYAAPEVLSRKSYDGGQTDVWSCAVILYVMLTGLLPFNCPADPRLDEGRRMRALYAAICNADYELPAELSTEAKDLIRAIFVPEPKRRITIEAIWDHPFLHKYDADFGYESTHMDHWIGPRPQIEDWKSLRREDIDREILRNMRTLWHSEKEETLIQRLLNDEPNHEKFFYSALLSHREEHLENYSGSPGGVGYSASDHQPLMPPTDSKDMPPLPTSNQVRSKSAYFILNDEHLQCRHSFYEHPPSEDSYDPFRASKDPIVSPNINYMNVTIHRGSSSGGSRRRKTGLRNSQRHPDPLRVEALKRGNRRSSGIPGTSVSLKGSPAQRSSVALRSSTSRLSTRSSLWPSSPPGVVRPNSMHKRAVNFSHLRRSSTASGLTDGPQYTPEQRKFLRRSHHESVEPLPGLPSSPVVQAHNVMRSRNENLTLRPPQLPVRNSRSPTRYIENEARKVSTELNKLCEEAFNRSSVGSSVRTSMTDKPNPYDTPPSSVSRISPSSGSKHPTLQNDVFDSRPLPPLPVETPTTFTARELAETRRRLAAKYAEDGKDNAEYFKEVLEHLDSLMPASSQPASYDSRRIVSAPAPKSPEDQGYLPVISEEGRFSDADELQHMNERNRPGYRAVTDPFGRKSNLLSRRHAERNTIRMVDPSSPTPIAPLNIRKASGASAATQSANPQTTRQQPLGKESLDASGTAKASRKGGKDFLIALDPDIDREGATTPNISTATDAEKSKPAPRKKSSWFRRKTSDDKETKGAKPKIPEAWQDLDDRVKNRPSQAAKHSKDNSDPTSSSSEFPMRRPAPAAAAKKSLWKMFGKKSAARQEGMWLRLGSSTDLSTSSLMSGFDLASTDSNNDPSARAAEATTQTNWLARFLHIKPASKILCFQVGRGRARSELVRLLREWRKFGVRDVVFDRKANTVMARVDKANHLKIKPVSFTAELFVMLEHGRRAQLCVARFTQTRGAASSFRRVVDIVEEVCRAKGLLVEQEERWRAMCEVLG